MMWEIYILFIKRTQDTQKFVEYAAFCVRKEEKIYVCVCIQKKWVNVVAWGWEGIVWEKDLSLLIFLYIFWAVWMYFLLKRLKTKWSLLGTFVFFL